MSCGEDVEGDDAGARAASRARKKTMTPDAAPFCRYSRGGDSFSQSIWGPLGSELGLLQRPEINPPRTPASPARRKHQIPAAAAAAAPALRLVAAMGREPSRGNEGVGQTPR